jgi:excinuclease ABC subunit A
MESTDSTAEPCEGDERDRIRVRGARVHNLKNVDVDIPRDRFVVITGPSGSGKSSLAFDTLFAEGQRQYIESLSVYARQFLHQMERPDVDLIDGLQPTICIDQRAGAANPRSTVATVTEIYDHLRLLMARVGDAACYSCGEPIRQQTAEQIQDLVLGLPEKTKAMVLAPLVRGRRGRHPEVFEQIRKAGLVRVRVDRQVFELDAMPELEPRKVHTIEAVVDRIVIREGVRSRLAESLQLAVRLSEGIVVITRLDEEKKAAGENPWVDRLFSTEYACPHCQISYEELEPRTFSFNSPYGACPACGGLGKSERFDPDLLLPDLTLSLADGGVAAWKGAAPAAIKKHQAALAGIMKSGKFDWETPLERLTPKTFERLLAGDGKKFIGVYNLLEKQYVTTTSPAIRQRLEAFRGEVICDDCGGARLRPEATSVRIGGLAIHQITAMSISEAAEFFDTVEIDETLEPIATPIITEIAQRLEFLQKVGLDYLTLNRGADTLSGGELQRVRLATGIGSGLVGVCYILDEPSIGLHPRDNQRLIDALRDLQEQGNTVIVVEHDEAMMRQADQLIDIGPGAGAHGGQVVSQGTPPEVLAEEDSVTGQYLSGRLKIDIPAKRRRIAKSRSLSLEGVTRNNLKQVDVQFPLGAFVCVTGVSGSGKSSLLNETLAPALARRLGRLGPKAGPFTSLRGVSQLDKLIQIDQSPIGRTPRSNAATYTGVFDEIRKVFAGTREAKQRGFKASRFSFNVKGGRCEVCQGQGLQKIEMNFLPDLYVTCDECKGARFNQQTLTVRYREMSIADVLGLSVDQAVEQFENHPLIYRMVSSLQEVGLGYLTLGQPSTMISGGEAQRIKLATELGRVETGQTLYLLDEPTTGLHFDDVGRLLAVLDRLVDLGNSVIVIEHNLDVIKCADWIIDLGPEGGQQGGYLAGVGTPEEIAALEGNHTGQFLRSVLNGAMA